MTIEQFKDWLTNTDAELTFIGKPLGDLSDLSKRNALDTKVTYCTKRIDNICGGVCTVYNGGAACIPTPNTNCLSATNDVGYCNEILCGGSCNQYSATGSDCGTAGNVTPRLENNFCYTPNTQSIVVGTA